MAWRIKVKVADGHEFTEEVPEGRDVNKYVRDLVETGAVENHRGGGFTLHPGSRVVSIRADESR